MTNQISIIEGRKCSRKLKEKRKNVYIYIPFKSISNVIPSGNEKNNESIGGGGRGEKGNPDSFLPLLRNVPRDPFSIKFFN